ncbi:MAG: CD225/dispanin family protein [Bacteroidia bacterium]|nr:CD225/dispanin family protein [Bacteroidia bacterium]
MEINNSQMNQQYANNSAPSFLPPHSNMMVWSILVTIFCCLVGGIVAIVYSARSNDLYNCAVMTQDERMRQYLYNESVNKNSTAKTWILISVLAMVIIAILYFVFIGGLLALVDM